MATLKTKIERLLRKGKGEWGFIILFNGCEINFNTRKNDEDYELKCDRGHYKVKCSSMKDLELIFPSITNAKVIKQVEEHYGFFLYIEYDIRKSEIGKLFKQQELKYLEEKLDENKDAINIVKEIISLSAVADEDIGEALSHLSYCFREKDYKVLQTMLYMIKNKEVKKAKVIYPYNDLIGFWKSLGHKSYRIKNTKYYCIELCDNHKVSPKTKIKEITNEHILFDNEMEITFDHKQDCCEYNYADFEQLLDQDIEEVIFDTDTMVFEEAGEHGFRFGSNGTHMYFVPCYSEQNGYYTTEVDIYFNGKRVLSTNGEYVD